ncbi:arylsulfatase B isoform X2 [Aethina tumida]|uniref:arylsulfatase B isoform X2 n=1 Tax=Aethina tumida TaxID=116153 RepID=UPI00096B0DB4|nr:arylsulfatase B isoform X2 [Aethina tumida]
MFRLNMNKNVIDRISGVITAARNKKMLLCNASIVVVVVIAFCCIKLTNAKSQRPNIIFIMADDLGWNDVGFHGSNEIPTPNIDALAYSGLILNNYYVTPICTPSRSTLMTGKYAIHTGMQHTVLFGAEARGLPLTEKILPQYLKELGYDNHIVGKWHLGSYTKEYLPMSRGFDSHLGYWTGHQDYFDHYAVERPGFGLDMRRGMEVAYDLHGKYSTDIFTEESVKIISKHNTSKPLFLYLAHAAVHSGNPYNPLPAPDSEVQKFEYIKDYNRRRFAAMLSKLDQSVGEVVKALNDKGMLDNSIIIFTTDNGGPAAGFNLNAASNYPLKGVKNTLWEGGVRGAACVWSPLIKKSKRIALQMMHISDWLPTLLEAVGGNVSKSNNLDGVSLWNALSNDDVSTRSEILHNIDDEYGNAAVTVGPWKIVKGTTYGGQWDYWYGPNGRNYAFNASLILNSKVGKTLNALGKMPKLSEIEEIRKNATIDCQQNHNQGTKCNPVAKTCLFNIIEDPCELNDVANHFPEILHRLEETLSKYNETAIPPGNLPLDPRGNPKYHNFVWTNFGDFYQTIVESL